ncbi:MAG: hypothetical protein ACLQUT_00215 [Thermoleophilia bacterium]
MNIAVTIDVEADNQWDFGVPVTTQNVSFWAPFQDLCERHGVTPTYLVATEIVADDLARELLRSWWKRGVAEIGAHLHPWTTPPFADRPGLRFNDSVHMFPSQLPDDLLCEKLSMLTAQIDAAVGVQPTSYRAGRFGFDLRAATFLAGAGYRVDSSVTPLTSWRKHPGLQGVGGPDFSKHSSRPFLIDGLRPNSLVEIPVTVLPTYKPLATWPWLLHAYKSLPVRAVRKQLLARWLRPQPIRLSPDPRYTADDLAHVVSCASSYGLDTAVMMFHSSELMPGGSPFRPDARSVQELLQCLDRFFSLVRQQGCGFSTLTLMAGDLTVRAELEVKRL